VKNTPARNNMYDRRDIAFHDSYRVDHFPLPAMALSIGYRPGVMMRFALGWPLSRRGHAAHASVARRSVSVAHSAESTLTSTTRIQNPSA